MRTKASVCQRKRRYETDRDARDAARHIGLNLRPYRCDRCRGFHLTSRTKGKFVGKGDAERVPRSS